MKPLIAIIGSDALSCNRISSDSIMNAASDRGYEVYLVEPDTVRSLVRSSIGQLSVRSLITLKESSVSTVLKTEFSKAILEVFPLASVFSSEVNGIHELLTNGSIESLVEGIKPSENLRAAYRLIYDRLNDPGLSLSVLQRELGVTKYRLEKDFKASGLPGAASAIARIRFREAKRLLIESPALAVYQVGFAVGFQDLSSFDRRFKMVTGMTPREYRNHMLSRQEMHKGKISLSCVEGSTTSYQLATLGSRRVKAQIQTAALESGTMAVNFQNANVFDR